MALSVARSLEVETLPTDLLIQETFDKISDVHCGASGGRIPLQAPSDDVLYIWTESLRQVDHQPIEIYRRRLTIYNVIFELLSKFPFRCTVY